MWFDGLVFASVLVPFGLWWVSGFLDWARILLFITDCFGDVLICRLLFFCLVVLGCVLCFDGGLFMVWLQCNSLICAIF